MMGATALTYAMQLMGILPQLIGAGIEIKTMIENHNTKLDLMVAESRNPTEAEWIELNTTIAKLRVELHS